MVQPESRHVGGYLRRQHERVSELDRASGIQEERFYRGIGQDADQGAREVQTRRSLLARQGSLGRFVADVPFDVYERRVDRRPTRKGAAISTNGFRRALDISADSGEADAARGTGGEQRRGPVWVHGERESGTVLLHEPAGKVSGYGGDSTGSAVPIRL